MNRKVSFPMAEHPVVMNGRGKKKRIWASLREKCKTYRHFQASVREKREMGGAELLMLFYIPDSSLCIQSSADSALDRGHVLLNRKQNQK